VILIAARIAKGLFVAKVRSIAVRTATNESAPGITPVTGGRTARVSFAVELRSQSRSDSLRPACDRRSQTER